MQVPGLRLDTLDTIAKTDRTLEPIASDLQALITEVRERRALADKWKTRAESTLTLLKDTEEHCKKAARAIADLEVERDFWKGCAAQSIDKWIDEEDAHETTKQQAEHWKRSADHAVAGWEAEEREHCITSGRAVDAETRLAEIQADANRALERYRDETRGLKAQVVDLSLTVMKLTDGSRG